MASRGTKAQKRERKLTEEALEARADLARRIEEGSIHALLAEYGDGRWPDPPLEWIEAVDGALSEIPSTPRRI